MYIGVNIRTLTDTPLIMILDPAITHDIRYITELKDSKLNPENPYKAFKEDLHATKAIILIKG